MALDITPKPRPTTVKLRAAVRQNRRFPIPAILAARKIGKGFGAHLSRPLPQSMPRNLLYSPQWPFEHSAIFHRARLQFLCWVPLHLLQQFPLCIYRTPFTLVLQPPTLLWTVCWAGHYPEAQIINTVDVQSQGSLQHRKTYHRI